MLTKGAIGNLVNRYRAVLKKCHLMNVFGSLAVAGMLVMGGAETAGAVNYTTVITGNEKAYTDIKQSENGHITYTFNEGDTLNTESVWGAIDLMYNSVTIKKIDSITNTTSDEEGYAVYLYGNKQILNLEDVKLTSVNTKSSNIAVANGMGILGGVNTVNVGNGDIKASASMTALSDVVDSRAVANGIDVEHGGILTMGTGNIFVEALSNGEKEHSVTGRGVFVWGWDQNNDSIETKVDKKSGDIKVTAKAGKGAWSSDAYGVYSEGKGKIAIGEGNILTEATGSSADVTSRGVCLLGESTLSKGNGNIGAIATATDSSGSAQAFGVQALDNTQAELGKVNITVESTSTNGGGNYNYAYGLDAVGDSYISMAGGTIKVKALQGKAVGINATTMYTNTSGGTIHAGSTGDLRIEVEGKNATGIFTDNGDVTLGTDNTRVDIVASGEDAVGISFSGTSGAVRLNGNTTIDADIALQSRMEDTTGTVLNNGNFIVNKGTVASFTGDYTQKKGATYLPGTDFFGGDVTLENGSLTVGNVDTSASSGANSMLALGRSITIADGQNLRIGTATGTGVVFGSGSALVVDGNVASTQAMIKGSDTLTVDKDSQLYVTNAKVGTSYIITEGMTNNSYWDTADLGANRLIQVSVQEIGDKIIVDTEVRDISSVLPGVIPVAGLTTMLAQNLNDTESDFMGARFLSRVTEPLYMSDDAKAVDTINEVSRASVTAGVQNTSLRLADAASDMVLHHLSLGNFDSGNSIHQNGWDIWATPMYGNTYTHGMSASGASVRGNYGGLAIGADTQVGTLADGNVRMGAAINGGGGKSETSGTATDTENSYNFGGVNLYAGWNLDSLNIMAALGYSMGSHDVKMNLPASLGMGQAKADVNSHAFTADLRAEYQFKTDWLDILPHAGVRYTALHMDSYDLKANGSTLNSVESDTQHIVQFPIGVTVTKNIDVAGWNIKPQADVSVIPAAGEKKAFTKVSFSGIDASDSVNTRIMDSTSWAGMLGIQAEKGNLALGLSYGVQASRHETDQHVQLNLGWKF